MCKERQVDVYLRYFTPSNGIDENSVTGSAHKVLCPYSKQVYPDKAALLGHQCSRRGKHVYWKLDNVNNRVYLEGSLRCPYPAGLLRDTDILYCNDLKVVKNQLK